MGKRRNNTLAAAFCAVASLAFVPAANANTNTYGITTYSSDLEELSKQFNEPANRYEIEARNPLADGRLDLSDFGLNNNRSNQPSLGIRDGNPEITFTNRRRHGPNIESERSFSIGVEDGKPSFRYKYELTF